MASANPYLRTDRTSARRSPNVEERVTSQISEWLTVMPERVVQAWTGGGDPPFSAKGLTGAERLAYFKDKAFLPNGQINEQGHRDIKEQYGTEGLAKVLNVLGRQSQPMAPHPSLEGLPEPNREADVSPLASLMPGLPGLPGPQRGY